MMKAKDNTPELTTTEKVAGSVEKFFSKNAKLIAIPKKFSTTPNNEENPESTAKKTKKATGYQDE